MIAWLMMIAAPVQAQTPTPPPQRIRSVTVYGDQPCPQSEGDEIVVCSRESWDDQFRIPKELRAGPVEAPNVSWTRRGELIQEVNRIGLPNSCSPVGTGGQTGCNSNFLRLWRDEAQATRAERSRTEQIIAGSREAREAAEQAAAQSREADADGQDGTEPDE